VRRVVVLGPTPWDREELSRDRYRGHFAFTFIDDEPILDASAAFGWRGVCRGRDVVRAIDRIAARVARNDPDGVVGTDEFLACAVAAAVAERLGKPGPPVAAVLRCQHKLAARQAMRDVVPEAVPEWAPVDPARPLAGVGALAFPLFVKPVRGTFSVLAGRVDSPAALVAHTRLSWLERALARRLLAPFDQLAARYADVAPVGLGFIAEQLLVGDLVTVEGWVCGGEVLVVGITDSIMHEGTISFRRFDYPSRIDPAVARRMEAIVRRLVPHLGLDRCLFNVELFHDAATGRIGIVEVNPRMAYQFADLYEKVDGANTYDALLALSVGERPRVLRGQGAHRAASSFVVRHFQDARVVRAPGAAEVRRVREHFPDARVHVFARAGRRLSDLERKVESYRLAIVNLGGADRADLDRRCALACRELAFALA